MAGTVEIRKGPMKINIPKSDLPNWSKMGWKCAAEESDKDSTKIGKKRSFLSKISGR